MAESPLMKVKAESENVGLKLNIEKTKIMYILGSKITAGGGCSHQIKRHLLLGKKAMAKLDSILKSITLPTKVCLVKALVFPVVLYVWM